MPINNSWIKAGALVAALAVTLGAFGEPWIPASTKNVNDFQTAVFFQLAHALALVAVGILMVIRPGRLLKLTGWLFLVGVVLFSGSIYLSLLTTSPWISPWILPFKMLGGAVLVVGWIFLVEGACPGWNKTPAEQDPN